MCLAVVLYNITSMYDLMYLSILLCMYHLFIIFFSLLLWFRFDPFIVFSVSYLYEMNLIFFFHTYGDYMYIFIFSFNNEIGLLNEFQW